MNEQAKIALYKQLIEIEKIVKMEEKVVEWEVFEEFDARKILKYAFSYRDRALEKFKKDKDDKKAESKFYLELPEMNLEGKDLSDIYLHMFMAGVSKERKNGKKIFITTNINLKDTNCTINLASLRPIIISEDGENIKEIVADVKKCDFRGCKVFGKFQNSKAKLEYGEENLPEEYIERLKKFEVLEDLEFRTDIVYINMIERKTINSIKELDKVKQMVDYDLSDMKKDIWRYRQTITKNNIDISFTGAFISEYGLESIGMENYLIDLDTCARKAYKAGDINYVEEVFKDLKEDTRRKLVTLALRYEKMDFVREHEEELRSFQKRYVSIRDEKMKEKEEENRLRELLKSEYKEGKRLDFDVNFKNASSSVKNDILKEIYEAGDLEFTERYLNELDSKLKNNILSKEYEKGNKEFVYRNFIRVKSKELKQKIIEQELEDKNLDFLCKYYENIDSKTIKNKVLELSFKEERKEFIRKYFDDFPKNMQIEAIVKYNDLGISKQKILELLNS